MKLWSLHVKLGLGCNLELKTQITVWVMTLKDLHPVFVYRIDKENMTKKPI